ncbi:MAG: tryptophan 7-halogenase, partial [Pseudomonadota bacterium]
ATYQLDRGTFENHLAELIQAQGVDLLDGATVRDIDLTPGQHRVRVRTRAGQEAAIQARFLVDTSGRRAFLRSKQDLKKPARHDNHALWFRVQGELDLDQWSSDRAWRDRCQGTPRRLSTNHFSGPGYWLWLIPLAGGYTSVGLVFDPKIVDPSNVRKHDALLRWLEAEHPLVAAHLGSLPTLDFHYLENYAASCRQVFSSEGWALSGDAGLFADPFYSPGSDFIAFSNSYICELIAREQPEATLGYQNELLSFFTNTLSLYRGQYGGFGDRDFMVAKTVWDYAYYWAVLSKLYFSGRFTDLRFMGEQKPNLLTASALNSGMQKQFREQARGRRRRGGEGRFFDHHSIVDFHRLKLELLRDAQRSDPAADAHELGNNVAWLQAMVPLVQRLARGEAAPELAGELRVSASQRRTEPTDTPVAPRPTPSDPVPRAAGY